MANEKQVPVQVVIKSGGFTVPANMPMPFEVVCQPTSTIPVTQDPSSGGSKAEPEVPIMVFGVRELSNKEPTEIDLDQDGTLVVDAPASEYELLPDIGRFARSPYLYNRNVNIVVRALGDE